MTPDQVKLVQESFAKVAPISETAAMLFYDRLFEIGEREAVDYRRGAVGKFGQRRFTIIRGKLDDLYNASAGPQAIDNVTVVQITAGQLIEPARDDKDELGHSSAAS